MKFKRINEPSYPCVYNTWEADGVTFVIQDLAPEDDEKALKILKTHLLTEEVLCSIQKISEDPVYVQEFLNFWRKYLQQRMSIGCYVEKDGRKTLMALNVCSVESEGEAQEVNFKGEKCKNVYDVVLYAENQVNVYQYMGFDRLLHGAGLIVKKEYRGKQLGQKILAAREPLCLSQGIKGTVTVFTGIASQKSATQCGFDTIVEFSIADLAKIGLPYPEDDERRIKFMAKKYV